LHCDALATCADLIAVALVAACGYMWLLELLVLSVLSSISPTAFPAL
jgi:hypothetical protein